MQKKLKKNFVKIFKENNLNQDRIIFRDEEQNIWNHIVKNSSFCSVYYTNSFINYQNSYFKSVENNCYELSVIYIYNDKPIAAIPIFVTLNKFGKNKIYFLNEYLIPPLQVKNLGNKIEKKFLQNFLSLIKKFSQTLKVKLKFLDKFIVNQEITNFHYLLLEQSKKRGVSYNLYSKINKDINVTKNYFRKSYKSLINRENIVGFSFNILKKNDYKTWLAFKKLHKKESGKVTRSKKSWDIQYKNIQNENALFLYFSKKDKIVAGALFDISKDEALYSVGVYSSEFKHIPFSHMIQFRAIKEFTKLNIGWYNIGNYMSKIMDKSKQKKEYNISFFKSGFSSHLSPNFIFYL